MGLDCSHDAWHGAYSAFHRWRCKIAEVAGLPPLELMEDFYGPLSSAFLPTLYYGPDTRTTDYLRDIDSRLPISWECLKPDSLHTLLRHSDCDGEIGPELCVPIADRLESLLPAMPDGDGGGHIGVWREKTQRFIDGLRAAAAAGEPLDFH